MNEKKEVESSKKLVANSVHSEKGAVIGSVNVKSAKKISKKHIMLLGTILLLIFIVIIVSLFVANRMNQNLDSQENLNNIMSTAPSNQDKQYEWSIKTSEQLENDTTYKNGDNETKTEYYNNLIGLYINQKSEKKARDLYMNEIHKNSILINSNYLNWLYKNYLLIENKEAAVIVIDDLIKVYSKDYETAIEQNEKNQLSQSIDELKATKERLDK